MWSSKALKNLKTEVQIPFFDADPAGILFYGNVFRIVHAAFEELLPQMNFTWREWFENPTWAAPIRHASADYRAPIKPGERYEVVLSLQKIGDSSLQWQAAIRQNQISCCLVSLVASFMDRKTHQKRSLPPELREKLLPFVSATPAQ